MCAPGRLQLAARRASAAATAELWAFPSREPSIKRQSKSIHCMWSSAFSEDDDDEDEEGAGDGAGEGAGEGGREGSLSRYTPPITPSPLVLPPSPIAATPSAVTPSARTPSAWKSSAAVALAVESPLASRTPFARSPSADLQPSPITPSALTPTARKSAPGTPGPATAAAHVAGGWIGGGRDDGDVDWDDFDSDHGGLGGREPVRQGSRLLVKVFGAEVGRVVRLRLSFLSRVSRRVVERRTFSPLYPVKEKKCFTIRAAFVNGRTPPPPRPSSLPLFRARVFPASTFPTGPPSTSIPAYVLEFALLS